MSVIVEYSIDASRLALGQTLERHPSVRVDVEQSLATGAGELVLFAWLSGDDLEAVEPTLGTDPTVADVERYEDVGGHRLYRLELATDRVLSLTERLVESGGVRLDAHAIDGRWHERVLFPDRDALAAYREVLDVDLQFKRVYESNGLDRPDFGLTETQRETLVLARKRGFFEVPRRATTGDLAEELGVSDQAVSERLRRGYARLVESTLG